MFRNTLIFYFLLISSTVASAMKAIDLIENDTSLPGRMLDNVKYFVRLVSQFTDEMLKRGMHVISFSYPIVILKFLYQFI
jgi:hypothetical protein